MPWQLQTPQRSLSLTDTVVVLGSDSGCAWREPQWRPKHARLRLVAGTWFLETIDDAPLWINGQTAKNGFLKAGDQFQLDSRVPAIGFSAMDAARPLAAVASLPEISPLPAAPPAPVKPRSPNPRPTSPSPLPPATADQGRRLAQQAVWVATGVSVTSMLVLFCLWQMLGSSRSEGTAPGPAAQGQPILAATSPSAALPQPQQQPQQQLQPQLPVQQQPPPLATYAVPEESLVFIGIQSSGAQAGTPVLMSVGWLVSPNVVLFPRTTLLAWQSLERALAQDASQQRFLCAIQWNAKRILRTVDCPEVDSLAIAYLAESGDTAGDWALATGADSDLARVHRSQRLRMVSYRKLPRQPQHSEQIIGMFDSNLVVVTSGRPTLMNDPGIEPRLAPGPVLNDDGQEMEKCGLLVVDGKQIAGLILPSGEILPANRLQRLITDAVRQLGPVAGAQSR